MPTGYTADVGDGKVTDFARFAMSCARAFGACIMMRDDPMDAPIPDEFKPSDYNAKELDEARTELARLEAMDESHRCNAALKDYGENVASWERYEHEKAEKRIRYDAMLAKVKSWTPPTSEHDGLKNFMVKQLEESIRFDCGPSYSKKPEPVSVEDWYAKALAKANHDIAYHAKAQAEEIERARGRTKWVAELRASLLPKSAAAETV